MIRTDAENRSALQRTCKRLEAWRIVAGALLAAVLVGCASPTQPDPAPTDGEVAPGIYHVDSGERITFDQLVASLSEATYIAIGEQHGAKWQHGVQAKVFRRLVGDEERRLALGMEMFQRPFQEPLDAYVRGKIDESTMLERAQWESRWGTDPALYRPLWRTAKEAGVPLVALNVRRELTSKIARVGLDGLAEEERAELPRRIDTSFEKQRAYVREAFRRHDVADQMEFEYFLEAQATWDEGMADTALDAVASRTDAEGIVIVAGRAHARRDFGIPQRIERRIRGDESAEESASVVSLIPYELGEDAFPGVVNAPADYVWLSAPGENPRASLRSDRGYSSSTTVRNRSTRRNGTSRARPLWWD